VTAPGGRGGARGAEPLETVDLVIVGAGPAGTAAALAALRERPGARVVVLDRSPAGRDKVCGDGIAPHTVAELRALGVDPVRPDEEVDAVRLSRAGGTDAAVGAAPGWVVPRAVFDERLLRAATDAGAEFVQHRVATVVADDGGATVDGRWRAPVVIGADGSTSVVRAQLGLPSNRGGAMAVAVRGYAPTPAGADRALDIRWDLGRGGGLRYAWAFPTADGTSNIGYGMSTAALTGGRAELERRMRDLLPEYAHDIRLTGHTLPLSIARPVPAVGRVLLTGDAASLVNPLTGEGIFSAVASGAAAGRAAMRDPATAGAVYRRELRARFGAQHRQLRLLYPLIGSRRVLDAVVAACREDPRRFARLLDVGLGARTFSARDAVSLARRLAVRR
jgi:menaquinone-9 beta-reductase